MNKYSPFHSLIKGAGFVLAGNFFIYFLGFIYHIPVVRILGPEKYGLWGLVYTIITIIAPLSMVGLGTGIIYYLSRAYSPYDERSVKGVIISSGKILLITSSIVTAGVIIFTTGWAKKLFPYQGIKPLLYIMAFSIPFFAFINFGEGVFRAIENARAGYEVKILQDSFKLFFIPIALWFSKGNLVLK